MGWAFDFGVRSYRGRFILISFCVGTFPTPLKTKEGGKLVWEKKTNTPTFTTTKAGSGTECSFRAEFLA